MVAGKSVVVMLDRMLSKSGSGGKVTTEVEFRGFRGCEPQTSIIRNSVSSSSPALRADLLCAELWCLWKVIVHFVLVQI